MALPTSTDDRAAYNRYLAQLAAQKNASPVPPALAPTTMRRSGHNVRGATLEEVQPQDSNALRHNVRGATQVPTPPQVPVYNPDEALHKHNEALASANANIVSSMRNAVATGATQSSAVAQDVRNAQQRTPAVATPAAPLTTNPTDLRLSKGIQTTPDATPTTATPANDLMYRRNPQTGTMEISNAAGRQFNTSLGLSGPQADGSNREIGAMGRMADTPQNQLATQNLFNNTPSLRTPTLTGPTLNPQTINPGAPLTGDPRGLKGPTQMSTAQPASSFPPVPGSTGADLVYPTVGAARKAGESVLGMQSGGEAPRQNSMLAAAKSGLRNMFGMAPAPRPVERQMDGYGNYVDSPEAQLIRGPAPVAPPVNRAAVAGQLRAQGGTWGNVATPAPTAAQGVRPVGGGSGVSMNTARGLKALDDEFVAKADGGDVPGKGSGDKIPAMYEPGEFVVSNDMFDRAPGLRGELRGLRAETLASKGVSVEEADRNALRSGPQGVQYGQQKGRAQGLRDDPYSRELEYKPDTDQVGSVGSRSSDRPVIHREGKSSIPLESRKVTLRAINGLPDDWMKGAWNTGTAGGPAETTGTFSAREAASKAADAEFAAQRAAQQAAQAQAAMPGSGGYANHFAPEAPGPSRAYTAGKAVRAVLDAPTPTALKVLGAGSAAVDGWRAATAAQNGNYADALDKGSSSVAALLSTVNPIASRLGAAGLAYTGGRYVGGKIYDNMDETQRDGVGYAVNKLVRGAGKMVGQDWGVDDSAHLRLNGIDPAATTPAAAPPPQFAEANRVVPIDPSALPRTVNPQALRQAPETMGQFGPTRADYEDTLRRNAPDTTDPFVKRVRETLANGGHIGSKTMALYESLVNNAASNATGMYGHDISREGHYLSNATAKANARFGMMKDLRDFSQRQEKQSFDMRGEQDKNLTTKLEAFHTRPGADGQPETDKAAVASSKLAINARLHAMMASAQARGDTEAVEALRSAGPNAIGEADLQQLLIQNDAKERARAAHGVGPFSGNFIDSPDPSAYDITGVEPGFFQNQYVLRNNTRVPTKALDYTRGGSAWLPNGLVDTRTSRFAAIDKRKKETAK